MVIKLSIIGGGVMGEALLSRLVAQQVYSPDTILVSDPQAQRRDYLIQQYGVHVTSHNPDTLHGEVILLAIKPQILPQVMADLKADLKVNTPLDGSVGLRASLPIEKDLCDRFRTASEDMASETTSLPLIISILAGVTLLRLEMGFPGFPVVRAMPNTPATVGAGVTAIAPGSGVSQAHLELTRTLFKTVGTVVDVAESLMDAVTGLSGSGPAYVAMLVEALSDGGVAAGLPRAIASQLALQTVLGTAQLLHTKTLHPAQLKDQVTSPGGTTIAGVAQLERSGFRSAVIEAVRAATHRSQELGQFP